MSDVAGESIRLPAQPTALVDPIEQLRQQRFAAPADRISRHAMLDVMLYPAPAGAART